MNRLQEFWNWLTVSKYERHVAKICNEIRDRGAIVPFVAVPPKTDVQIQLYVKETDVQKFIDWMKQLDVYVYAGGKRVA